MKKKNLKEDIFSKDYSPSSVITKAKNADYSDIVRWLKILLPTIAAFLCGLLILIPRIEEETNKISLSIAVPKFGEVEKLRMANPNFVGNDKKNNVFNIIAKEAIETKAGSKIMELIDPKANIPTSPDNWYEIDSDKGFYHQTENKIELVDGVTIFSSNGISVETEIASFDFNKEYASGDKKIHAQGEFGTIDASEFEFFMDKNIFVFKKDAKMVVYEDEIKRDKK